MAKKKRDVTNEPWIENYPPLADWLRLAQAFCVWQIPYGPAKTPTMHVEQWCFPGGTTAIITVQADRRGWDIFTGVGDNDITATLTDAEQRLGLKPALVAAAPVSQPKVKPQVEPKPIEMAPCWLCNETCDKADNLCRGCAKVVCEKCCTAEDQPMGRHDPAAHMAED